MRYWFKAKKYGYGWYPATWEGWAVMLLWFVAFFRLVFQLVSQLEATRDSRTILGFLPLFLIITLALIGVCWAKGEPARWRWGDDK